MKPPENAPQHILCNHIKASTLNPKPYNLNPVEPLKPSTWLDEEACKPLDQSSVFIIEVGQTGIWQKGFGGLPEARSPPTYRPKPVKV